MCVICCPAVLLSCCTAVLLGIFEILLSLPCYNSSRTRPSSSSFLARCRSSFCIRRSLRRTVRCSFSHMRRDRLPSSLSVTDMASTRKVMSRLPRSRCGLVWSMTHARIVSSSAWGLYLVRLLSAPILSVSLHFILFLGLPLR